MGRPIVMVGTMKRFHRQWVSFLTLLPFAAGTMLRAQLSPGEAAAKAAAPSAQFAQLSVNFGQVKPADIQRHVFTVTNTGAVPLLISDVAAGCGCTTTGTWDKEIAPGATGRIPIEFNPANFSGEVHKSVVVSTNDPARPTQTLDLRANVWRPFEIIPAFTGFLPVEGEPRAETKVVRILNNLAEPAKLHAPESTNPQFQTALKAVRDGREYELSITYDSAIPGSSVNATITIKTGRAEQPILSMTAFAMPQPSLVTIPATLQLPAGKLGPGVTHNIVVRNNASAPLKITDTASSVSGIRLTVTESQPGRLYYVSAAFPAGYEASAAIPAIITVKTSHPRYPEIRVPIVPEAASAQPTSLSTGK